MKEQVRDEVVLRGGSRPDDPATKHLLSLFCLNVRNDSDTLKDKDMEELHQLYRDAGGGSPMYAGELRPQYFLLVDEEVVGRVSTHAFWIKYVPVYSKATDYIPTNPQLGGKQRYFRG